MYRVDVSTQDTFQVWSGNPRVQVLVGTVKLFTSHTSSRTRSVPPTLPPARGTLLCVLGIPSHMSIPDLISFLNPFTDDILSTRVVRGPTAEDRFVALVTFRSQAKADDFFLEKNAMAYDSLGPAMCRLLFAESVEFSQDGEAEHKGDEGRKNKDGEKSENKNPNLKGETHKEGEKSEKLNPNLKGESSPHMQVPSCPVCLDTLDASVTGIITTLCNHSFHCGCLSLWRASGSSCPVCRQAMHPIDESEYSVCEKCDADTDIWMCLICGHIGCGRYVQGHATCHYEDSGHSYAVELKTQRVWDYAGDGYVHRLVQNAIDGKMMALPDPGLSPMEREREREREGKNAEGEGKSRDELAQAKSMAAEYNQLLSTQLVSQREYYEKLLAQERKKRKKAEKKALEGAKAKEECAVLQEMNEHMSMNVKSYKSQVEDLEKEVAELKEQVHDFMMYIEAGAKVQANPELANGGVGCKKG